jgi:CRISPR-associated protein Cas1
MGIDGIVLAGARSVSVGAMERIVATGRDLTLLDWRGHFIARLSGPTTGSVYLRIAQYTAATGPAALEIARSMVLAKVQNGRRLVLRRRRDSGTPERPALTAVADALASAVAAASIATSLDQLRGHEGDAARAYFGGFDRLVVGSQRAPFALDGRNRRPPRTPMNALLSYLYVLLTHEAVAALESVGLDPQVGFLHAIRSGRPSLALDLVEELRAPAADRLALSLVNRQELGADDFAREPGGAVHLSESGRRMVARAWSRRRQEVVRHPLLKEEVPWGLVPHVQARILARHLRGELASYPAFLAPL